MLQHEVEKRWDCLPFQAVGPCGGRGVLFGRKCPKLRRKFLPTLGLIVLLAPYSLVFCKDDFTERLDKAETLARQGNLAAADTISWKSSAFTRRPSLLTMILALSTCTNSGTTSPAPNSLKPQA